MDLVDFFNWALNIAVEKAEKDNLRPKFKLLDLEAEAEDEDKKKARAEAKAMKSKAAEAKASLLAGARATAKMEEELLGMEEEQRMMRKESVGTRVLSWAASWLIACSQIYPYVADRIGRGVHILAPFPVIVTLYTGGGSYREARVCVCIGTLLCKIHTANTWRVLQGGGARTLQILKLAAEKEQSAASRKAALNAEASELLRRLESADGAGAGDTAAETGFGGGGRGGAAGFGSGGTARAGESRIPYRRMHRMGISVD